VLLGESHQAQALTGDVASMATADDERFRVVAELIQARDARMQQRPEEALEQVDRTVKTHQLEALPLRVQSDVAAERGILRLEMGDATGAKRELERCGELLIRAQVAPSIPVTTCLVGAARLQLQHGRFAEAEQTLMPLAAAWAQVNPEGSGR